MIQLYHVGGGLNTLFNHRKEFNIGDQRGKDFEPHFS
jgi:hypothetical protein